ncbi:MAG TPA: dipeptidase, partial [Flavisolibacter sp.]|nr:dipeptidase [Flavisolibacter sp.]
KRYPNKIALVKNSKELKAAIDQERLAALVGVEGGHMIENRLDYLDSLAKRGMAYMTLTWNNSTPWATSAADENSGKTLPHKGLTDFGKEVVRRMNKLGVMVDLSHVGEQTLTDAIQVSTKPVIASHSCVYALNPVSRNLKDEQIKAIAKTGGVIFVNFYSGFLDPAYQPKYEALLAKYASEIADLTKQLGRKSKAIDKVIEQHKEEFEAIRPPLSLLIDHIDYIAKLVGVDHVGLGADYDGAESFPQQLDDVRAYPLVTEALLKRGYSVKDTEKMLGGNFIRVWKANTGR